MFHVKHSERIKMCRVFCETESLPIKNFSPTTAKEFSLHRRQNVSHETFWRRCNTKQNTHAYVRGGSVSRRGHSQAYRRIYPTHRRNQASRKNTSNASRSSGEGVQGERRFSQRSGLSPCIPLHNPAHLRYNSRKRVKGWAHDQVDRTAAGCD